MKKIGLLWIIAVSVFASSCLKDRTSPVPVNSSDCQTIISYSLDIKPIINTSCVTNQGPGTGCHDAWIFDYNNIDDLIEIGLWQGEVLVEKTMPVIPNYFDIDSLTADELQTMKCWIEQGFPEN